MKKKKRRYAVIAVAQIRYFDIHKKDNVEKIKKYIKMAKRRNADIVCFPESCVHKTKTLHFDDRFIKAIREECRKNQIWCIITEDFILRKKPYNLAILIDRNGEIKGSFKKMHLYGDSDKLNPGKRTRVYKTDFAKIGVMICWDLAFPELFDRMKKAGAEIVFCPSAWCYEQKAYDKNHQREETELLRSLARSRAFENLFFVAIANPVLDREDQVSYSAIVSPHKILKEIINKEGLISAKINLNEIKKLENLYPD